MINSVGLQPIEQPITAQSPSHSKHLSLLLTKLPIGKSRLGLVIALCTISGNFMAVNCLSDNKSNKVTLILKGLDGTSCQSTPRCLRWMSSELNKKKRTITLHCNFCKNMDLVTAIYLVLRKLLCSACSCGSRKSSVWLERVCAYVCRHNQLKFMQYILCKGKIQFRN